jgi:hypothetical protein
MGLFVLLAVLAWQTLSDPKIRAVTLLVIGLFAFRSWMQHRRNTEDSGKN